MRAFTSFFLCFIVLSVQGQVLTGDQKHYEGYFDFYYDREEDKIFLEVDKIEQPFLYTHFLSSGVGSNDVGLDRGQLGDGVIVEFRKAGQKLLLVQPNLDYRAITEEPAEKASVEEAFAFSVLEAFEILEKKGGNYIIDLTPFLLKDAHGVSRTLERGDHGSFSLDKSRSALSLERTKAFPENVEFEALLTFTGRAETRTLRAVLPDPTSISVMQHHSFIKLPDDNFQKRIFDPRSGTFSISYSDYASPVYEPIVQRYSVRHRLRKKNPEARISEPIEPIVYYLDPGIPEPVRSALLEGAQWWGAAFEEIGYKNAFEVKVLPPGVDPLDVRYNVIQWVHRSTRGWSYGASVVDPRTGEILKGHVSLGSLRIRQDFMIAQALLDRPFAQRDDNHSEMLEMALARIRQLAAHEVGHTLGFAHNFAASVNQNASVMDYPHPQFRLNNGRIDLSQAYDSGIGAWDKLTVRYNYGVIPKGVSQREFGNEIIAEASSKGLQFISDNDARAAGGAHINAHLWDNGRSAVEELKHILKVRKIGIDQFSVDNIRKNEPYSVLEDVFVPLYFLHRYQTEAAVKLVGGLNYNYAVKGGTEKPYEVLDSRLQEQALKAVLQTVSAEVLAIPEEKLALFPPRAYGYGRTRESFSSKTGVSFDAIGAPAAASNLSLSLLLHPERAARLVQQKALDNKLPGLEGVQEKLISETLEKDYRNDYYQKVQNAINFNVVMQLIELAANPESTVEVKAITNETLDELQGWLSKKEGAIYDQLHDEIRYYKKNPADYKPLRTKPDMPDGSPIGNRPI